MGPTWIRRGTQGHVAEPRGPTRAPAWRGGDTCALTGGDREIVNFTLSRVKKKSKLTNLMKLIRIVGYNGK